MSNFETNLVAGWQDKVDEDMDEAQAPDQFEIKIYRDRDNDPVVRVEHIDCDKSYESARIMYPFPLFFTRAKGRRMARRAMRSHMQRSHLNEVPIEKYVVTLKPKA